MKFYQYQQTEQDEHPTFTSHHWTQKKTTTYMYGVGNLDLTMGQAQKSGRNKPDNETTSIYALYVLFLKGYCPDHSLLNEEWPLSYYNTTYQNLIDVYMIINFQPWHIIILRNRQIVLDTTQEI